MGTEIISVSDIEKMAQAVATSGLFGVKNPAQALALMLVAQAEGRHPALAARDYDVIQNRPAKKSEAMLRDFLAGGGKVEWHRLDDTVADATFSHPAGGSVRITWDFDRARRAGLGTKDMWSKYPRQMLRSRCVSEGVRTVWPSATSGMYVPEEVQDFQTATPRGPIDITPSPQAEPPKDDDSKEALESAAQLGTDALKACWERLNKDQRKACKPLLDSLKAQAQAVDAKTMQATQDEAA